MSKYHRHALFVILGTVFSAPAQAAFTWKLDTLEASGDITFSDDFDDGLLNVPPTSNLAVFLGTVAEAGSNLIFSDSDGTGVDVLPVPGTMRDTVNLTTSIPDDGAGTTWTGSFVPELGAIVGLPNGSGYGLQLNNASVLAEETFAQATIAVISDGAGNALVGLFDETLVAIDSAIIGGVSGNIVLSLIADPSNDVVSGAYSLDGGNNFTAMAGTVTIPGTLTAWAFGQMTPVPLPAVWPLFAVSLVVLAIRKESLWGQVFN